MLSNEDNMREITLQLREKEITFKQKKEKP